MTHYGSYAFTYENVIKWTPTSPTPPLPPKMEFLDINGMENSFNEKFGFEKRCYNKIKQSV